ncbi:dTDP-4-amino-4,6-dideoxygalactose transaminase [Singulisphaera sp. GP187]|uniref:DegT/DnrJ/EryC1/StrS family aminotransferase n=1 Tax=Singulisphaera sp. GP187 TaxID=1882752 RepID=UPI00092AB41B|nr:DegT/DnrJ/EryC1/StrS family aminotransferase [Singulisphaera sp. GP187]SIO22356.1 dTDP-4-amino-4,6-dideoxygalactose transaminase [Singulisphaera sp. GP187]
MTPKNPFSRRQFLAATSGAMGAAKLYGQEEATPSERLALQGGPKAVQGAMPKHVRWGEPEREQMNALIDQANMFYWKGPQTTLLIDRFRQTCPLEHVMTCSSGTAALHIAVAAAGIEPGDEVITSPISDIGTVIGTIYQQAVPVFADLGRNTYNLDPEDVAQRITPKTKAIIAVHLAGNPCDMHALKTLADQHNLVLIEDCAQAWGAKFRGKPIGTVGHIGCFSLQAAKHVTSGEGGVVASSDPRFGPLLQRFGDKGMDRLAKGGLFEVFATNYRMSEPQAGFAAAQLTRVEGIAEKRSQLGNRLNAKLAGAPGIEPHQIHADDRSTYWFLMFRLRPEAFKCDRAEFVKALAAEGVPASAGYIPVPLYGNPVFQKHGFFAGRWPVKELGLTTMDYAKVSCPEAEAILKTGVRITIHEGMSEDYVLSLAAAVQKVATHYAV